jgi:SAM-dependent methyltransferase
MEMNQYLPLNSEIFKNKTVLDLACHTGESTKIIHKLGAAQIWAVDIRPELINQAQQTVSASNIEFIVGDITDYQLIPDLVSVSNTISCFGVLYHLFDHFRFFSHILKPNIEHVLIETEFGSESLNPEMHWGFESTDRILNGRHNDLKVIPHGTPNLSWILQSADIFGFKCDWINYYGCKTTKPRQEITSEEYFTIAGPDWPEYSKLISTGPVPEFVENEIAQFLHVYTRRRMIIRLYNSNLIKSTPLVLKDVYQWSATE